MPGSQVVRFGSPPNRFIFKPGLAAPSIGGSWEPTIHHGPREGPTMDWVVVASNPANVYPHFGGTLLVDLSGAYSSYWGATSPGSDFLFELSTPFFGPRGPLPSRQNE